MAQVDITESSVHGLFERIQYFHTNAVLKLPYSLQVL